MAGLTQGVVVPHSVGPFANPFHVTLPPRASVVSLVKALTTRRCPAGGWSVTRITVRPTEGGVFTSPVMNSGARSVSLSSIRRKKAAA